MSTPPESAFRSALIVLNPKSGQGDSGIEAFAQFLRDAQVKVTMRETTPDGTPESDVHDLAEYDALVGAGGDGTVSSLAYAARTAQKPYLPYPAGTANLIAQNLKLPTTPRELADVFLAGRTLTLDLAELDVAGQTHGFAMLAGLGIDAAMIRDSEEEKSSLGAGAYVASALKQLRPETAQFTVTLDDRELQVEGMGVMVANFGMANFRMPITGDVNPADGKLSVIVLKGNSIAALIPSLIGSVRAKLNLGDPDLGDALETYESSEVRVKSSRDLPAQYDGETLPDEVSGFTARALPGAVRYITGASLEELKT